MGICLHPKWFWYGFAIPSNIIVLTCVCMHPLTRGTRNFGGSRLSWNGYARAMVRHAHGRNWPARTPKFWEHRFSHARMHALPVFDVGILFWRHRFWTSYELPKILGNQNPLALTSWLLLRSFSWRHTSRSRVRASSFSNFLEPENL